MWLRPKARSCIANGASVTGGTDQTKRLALPPESAQEAQFKALWKRFYNTIAIAARENPVCRRTHCPRRYWAHMTELQDMPGVQRTGAVRMPSKEIQALFGGLKIY